MKKMGENGVIGGSGTWYPCYYCEHVPTMLEAEHDAPFVTCRHGDYAKFEPKFGKNKPTKRQFETLMDWCTQMGKMLEDVVIFDDIWLEFFG